VLTKTCFIMWFALMPRLSDYVMASSSLDRLYYLFGNLYYVKWMYSGALALRPPS